EFQVSNFKIQEVPTPFSIRKESGGEGFAPTTHRDYAAAYRAGTITPEQVAERLLAAVAASDQRDPPMRFFIAQQREDVLAQARAATARLRAGQPLSSWDGVPVAVKDEVDQAPYPTTAGTRFVGQTPAAQ